MTDGQNYSSWYSALHFEQCGRSVKTLKKLKITKNLKTFSKKRKPKFSQPWSHDKMDPWTFMQPDSVKISHRTVF